MQARFLRSNIPNIEYDDSRFCIFKDNNVAGVFYVVEPVDELVPVGELWGKAIVKFAVHHTGKTKAVLAKAIEKANTIVQHRDLEALIEIHLGSTYDIDITATQGWYKGDRND